MRSDLLAMIGNGFRRDTSKEMHPRSRIKQILAIEKTYRVW